MGRYKRSKRRRRKSYFGARLVDFAFGAPREAMGKRRKRRRRAQ